jgi:hypothetical protein
VETSVIVQEPKPVLAAAANDRENVQDMTESLQSLPEPPNLTKENVTDSVLSMLEPRPGLAPFIDNLGSSPKWQSIINTNRELQTKYIPACLGPRQNISEWESLGADKTLIRVIKHGVKLPLVGTPAPNHPRAVQTELLPTLEEYAALGVLQPLSSTQIIHTKYWVHTFSRPKANSHKLRLITNLKPLNQFLHTPSFKTDTWTTVTSVLKNNPDLKWAATLDLRNWFFHLGLHPQAQRWIRLKTKEGGYQFSTLPFGLQCSPYWSTRLAKPI